MTQRTTTVGTTLGTLDPYFYALAAIRPADFLALAPPLRDTGAPCPPSPAPVAVLEFRAARRSFRVVLHDGRHRMRHALLGSLSPPPLTAVAFRNRGDLLMPMTHALFEEFRTGVWRRQTDGRVVPHGDAPRKKSTKRYKKMQKK